MKGQRMDRKSLVQRRLMKSQQIHPFFQQGTSYKDKWSLHISHSLNWWLTMLPNFAIANRHLSCRVTLTPPTPNPQHSHVIDSLDRLKCGLTSLTVVPAHAVFQYVLARLRKQQAFVSFPPPSELALVMHLPPNVIFHARAWSSLRKPSRERIMRQDFEKFSRKNHRNFKHLAKLLRNGMEMSSHVDLE